MGDEMTGNLADYLMVGSLIAVAIQLMRINGTLGEIRDQIKSLKK